MANKDLFKQAIAEAKSVREAAIANAKQSLEESLTPHLKDMLAAKLQELEGSEEKEEVIAEEGLVAENDLGFSEAAEDDSEKSEDDAAEAPEGEEAPEEGGHDEDKEVSDLSVEDFKNLIRDIIAQEMGAGSPAGAEEAIPGEEMPVGDDLEAPAADVADGEEIDLEELLKELEGMAPAKEEEVEEMYDSRPNKSKADIDKEFADRMKDDKEYQKLSKDVKDKASSLYHHTKPNDRRGMVGEEMTKEEQIAELEAKLAELKGEKKEEPVGEALRQGVYGDFNEWKNSFKEGTKFEQENGYMYAKSPDGEELGKWNPSMMKGMHADDFQYKSLEEKKEEEHSSMKEALETIESLKKDLSEVNLLNAKLLYLNKVLKANNLSETQQVNVIAAFDKAETVKEVKLVFETICESLVTKKETSSIKESRGFASKATGTTATKPEVISEVSETVRRMQKLAGIIIK